MLFIGLGPDMRAPRKAACMRCSISSLVNSMRRFLRSMRDTKLRIKGALLVLADLPKGLPAVEDRFKSWQTHIDQIHKSINATTQDVLFSTAGRALTTWAKMEEALVLMTSILLRVPPEKAGLVMYSIFNFATWLSVINGLFELDEKLSQHKRRWTKISERLRKIKDQRDQLAHHAVNADSAKDPVLAPPDLDVRRKSKLQKPLDIEEVQNFTLTVMSITDDILVLMRAMNATLAASQDKQDEPNPSHSLEAGSQ